MKKTLTFAGNLFLLSFFFLFSFTGTSDAGTTPVPKPSQPYQLLAQAATAAPAPAPQPQQPLQTGQQPQLPGQPQQQPQAQPTPPPGQVPPPAPQPFIRAAQPAGGPVSFFFDDADIFEVVQTVFGDILKVNYLIDQRVKGKVNFRTITPIPREEVLPVMETILRINGIGFVEEKGLYRIVPLSDVSKELVYAQVGKDPSKVAIEMFTFKNTNLKEAMGDIENMIGLNVQGGTIRVIPIQRLNALIAVASSKEQMDYVRKWVEAFDNMFADARPKVMVYPLQNSKAGPVASMLASIFGGGGGGTTSPAAPPAARPPTAGTPTTAGAAAPTQTARSGSVAMAGGSGFLVSPETRIFADEVNNTLIILSTPADYAFIEETIKKIDVQPRQVLIEGLLVRVDLTDNLDFGMQWAIQNNFTLKPFGRSVNFQGPLGLNTLITPDALNNPAMFQFTALDAAGKVKLALQSLASQGKVKILASPHILVTDNREARIQVGQQVPIATSSTTTPLGGTVPTNTTTSTIQYKDIGIILKVKPQINDSGLVSLELSQEVSSLAATPVVIAGQDFSQINKMEASTNLVAQDGETIIIGGLIREDATKSRSGIPFLSRIPVLGYLFGSTNDDVTRIEVIILLTPHVMRNMQEAGSVTSGYTEKYKGLTKDKSIDKFMEERSQKGKEGGDSGAPNTEKK